VPPGQTPVGERSTTIHYKEEIMTTLLQDPPPPAPTVPPPISVTRDGRRYPHDYGGKMHTAWCLAWASLSHGDCWHDGAPLAANIARQAGIEVDSARGMLRQAVRRGVLSVRRRLRGEPRRWRVEYKVRPRTADSYERAAAALIERYLRSRGRRDGFHVGDLPAFHSWLVTVGEGRKWRRCRDGAGMDTDTDLLAALRVRHLRLVAIPQGSFRGGVSPAAKARGDFDPGEEKALLVADTAKPTRDELAGIRVHALRLVSAVATEDWAATWELRPRSVTDAGYLTTTLAELVVDLAWEAGHPLGAFIEQARSAAVRAQATGGRS
jgi:hypothetical protein